MSKPRDTTLVPVQLLRLTSKHILSFCALCVVIAACSRDRQERAEIRAMVRSAVHQKVGNADPVYVDLGHLLPFEWEAVYFFPPYTTREEIYETLGFRWRGAAHTSIEERDFMTLLVFVKGRRVVHHIEHPRVEGDFSRLGGGQGYTPEEAYFEVVEEGWSEAWLVIEEATRP